jgi:predicted acyl esterase
MIQLRPATNRTLYCLLLSVIAGLFTACSQRQFDSEQIPAGSSKVLAARLDAELARLGIDPQRVAGQAPKDAAGAVFDLDVAILETGTDHRLLLSWTEKFAGDYDQNGEVNAADLSPLGRDFGKAVQYRPEATAYGERAWPEGGWWDNGSTDPDAAPQPGSGAHNWRLARTDGDGNGELNLADVSSIAINWKAAITAYCIYRRSGPDGEYELLANPVNPELPFTIWRSAAYPAGSDSADPLRPLRFYHEVTETGNAEYSYYVAPYDEGSQSQGGAGNIATISPGGPLLRLDGSASPSDLQLALPAVWRFNGAGSNSESPIASYAWDADGDGSYEADTGSTDYYDYSYTEAGSYRATLRVTDEAGLSNVLSRIVHVNVAGALRPAVYRVEMSDGVGLSTHVYLPEGPGPWPAVLVRTPYGKDPAVYGPVADEMNASGYLLVTQDMRGRNESEGALNIPLEGEDMLAERDGVDSFAWLRQQSWCNGSIGTTGGSMLGMTQLYTAPHQPEGLRAQFIGVAPASMYHQFVYVGGAFCQQQMEQWVDISGYDPESLAIWRAYPEYDEYWEQFNVAGSVGNVETPGMHYGGWFDSFSQGTIDTWSLRQKQGGDGAQDRQWLVMGPWAHGTEASTLQGELQFPGNAVLPPDSPYSSFMDHFVLGLETGILQRAAVTYYRMGAIGESGAPGNDWQYATDWPVPHEAVSYYLHADGSLTTSMPDAAASLGWSFDPAKPAPTLGGRNLYEPKGPLDQQSIEERTDSLLFSTEPLPAPLEVTGRVLCNLFVASDSVDTDLAVRLTDVYPDGRSMLILDGILRLRYRDGFQQAVLLTPGDTYEVDVDLWSTSHVFNTGHRIRLALGSSNHPKWDLNPGTGKVWADGVAYVVQGNTLFCAPAQASALILPIVVQ